MHLHLWYTGRRKKGIGTLLIKMALPYFFQKYQLKKLICEPYAFNPAPNKTLEKVGFKFIKTYVTIPGSITFEQKVNRWEMSLEDFQVLDLAHQRINPSSHQPISIFLKTNYT